MTVASQARTTAGLLNTFTRPGVSASQASHDTFNNNNSVTAALVLFQPLRDMYGDFRVGRT